MSKFLIMTTPTPVPNTIIRWVQPTDTISSKRYRLPFIGKDEGCTLSELQRADVALNYDSKTNNVSVLKNRYADSVSNKIKVYYNINGTVRSKDISSDMISALMNLVIETDNFELYFKNEDDAVSFLLL